MGKTEEKHVAEWMRGIIDECDASGTRSCVDIAEMFGIDCKDERTCRDCKIDMMKSIADRIDREMAEYELLKKENAELKAELADWKGNAEGFQPDAYMKLPLDADGEPIRIGDKMDVDGDCMTMLGYRKYNGTLHLIVKEAESTLTYTLEPSRVRHFKPEPADSWEKLEKDMMRGTSCRYFGGVESALECWDCPHGTEQTGTPCWKNERIDILKRAKKLAGIEEEVRND